MRFVSGLVATLMLAHGVASAQTPPEVTAWAGSNCQSCHVAPVSGALNGTYPNSGKILDYADQPFTTTWCSTSPNSTTTMCQTYGNSYFSSTTNDYALIQKYLRIARDLAVVASNGVADGTTTFVQTAIGNGATKQLTLTNYRAQALEFAAAVTANTNEFTVLPFTTAGECGNGSGTNRIVPMAVGSTPGQCMLTLRFQPAPGTTTARNGTMQVQAIDTGSIPTTPHATLALAGSVPSATYGYTPASPAPTFVAQVGATTSAGPFLVGTIANGAGSATLGLSLSSTVSVGSATYTLDTSGVGRCAASQSLGAGGHCDVYVLYKPGASAGTTSASFLVSSTANAVATQQNAIVVSGTATASNLVATGASLSSANTVLAFGDSQTGQPKTLTFTLTNQGNAPIAFPALLTTRLALTGSNPSSFVVGGTCSTVTGLASQATPSQATCTISVQFTPTAVSPYAATLTVNSDANNGALPISLTGNGVQLPTADVVLTDGPFPDAVIDEPASETRHVRITNNRAYPVTYSLVGPTSGDFTVLPTAATTDCPAPPVVPASKSCIVTLQFKPTLGTGEGPRSAMLTVHFANANGDPGPNDGTVGLSGNALLPLRLSTTQLAPSTVINTSTTASAILTNRSASALTLSTFAFSSNLPADPAAAEYTVDASSGCRNAFVLASGTSCTLVVRFAPTAPTLRSATLTLVHTAIGSPQAIDLHGTGLDLPKPKIEVGSAQLAFPDTPLAAQSVQTLTVHNGAPDATLVFSGFVIGGTAATEYTRAGDCSVTSPLGPLQSCSVVLTFAPSSLGARSAALTIQSNASNGAAIVGLLGNGIPVPVPIVDALPTQVAFGTQTVAGLYPPQSVRLKNVGTAPLVVASVAIDGSGFALDPTACTVTLAPNASCDVAVRFAPTAATTYQATLRIVGNAAGSPYAVSLTGTGTASASPSLVWSPAASQLDFGAVSAGTVSGIQSVTLLDAGPGGATLTVANAVGPDAAAFFVSSSTCAAGSTIFQGQTCRFDIAFAPGSSGTKNAVLQIASTGSVPSRITLTGVGLAGPNAALALSVSMLTFEATRVGAQSAPQEVTISATGTGAVQVNAMSATGPYVVQGKTCAAPPFVLAAGVSCTVTATFQPQAEGVSGGVIRITTDVSPNNHDVALSGQGTPKPNVSGGGGGGGGGGCSIASGESPLDPTLWALITLAIVALLYRRRARLTHDARPHDRR